MAEGKDPTEVETRERVQYEYQPANYDEYLNQLQKKQEIATTKTDTKQSIIQKMYKDVVVGKYYNVHVRQ